MKRDWGGELVDGEGRQVDDRKTEKTNVEGSERIK